MTAAEFSRDKLGKSSGYATNLVNGSATPGGRLALEIERHTGIEPREWFQPPRGGSRSSALAAGAA